MKSSRQKLRVVPEFRDMLPPLSPDEYLTLEENLVKDGCREKVVVWKNHGVIVDGHNRYEICKKHNIRFEISERSFRNKNEAICWLIDNHLGRRNMTEKQKLYVIGTAYRLAKKTHGGKRRNAKSSTQNEYLKTADKIARRYKVSAGTVQRAEKFTEAVDKIASNVGPAAKRDILNHSIKTTSGDLLAIAALDRGTQAKIMKKTRITKDIGKAIKQADSPHSNREIKTNNKISLNRPKKLGDICSAAHEDEIRSFHVNCDALLRSGEVVEKYIDERKYSEQDFERLEEPLNKGDSYVARVVAFIERLSNKISLREQRSLF